MGGATVYLEGHLVISEFAFADVPGALLLDGDDDLAPFFEGVGDDAGVGDRHGVGAARAVGDAEVQHAAVVTHRAVDDGRR